MYIYYLFIINKKNLCKKISMIKKFINNIKLKD